MSFVLFVVAYAFDLSNIVTLKHFFQICFPNAVTLERVMDPVPLKFFPAIPGTAG